MSKDWVQDIAEMHGKFGVRDAIADLDRDKLKKFVEFRVKFLEEEMKELKKAHEAKDSEEFIDALIDLCVVAIGTLDAFRVNSYLAWDEVHTANMNKEVGIKESRPNPLGLPDLVKPEGWTGPDHAFNHGLLKKVFNE